MLLGNGSATNASTTISLRNIYDPSLTAQTPTLKPQGYTFWSKVYSSYRVRGCLWKIRWSVTDTGSFPSPAGQVIVGTTTWDVFSNNTNSIAPYVPTTWGGLDSALEAVRGQDQWLKWKSIERNNGGFNNQTRVTSPLATYSNMVLFKHYEKLSGKPRNAPSHPQDRTTVTLDDTLWTYPNYLTGSTGTPPTYTPKSFDRRVTLWAFSQPANAATTGILPYTRAYLSMLFYVEFFDPITSLDNYA